MKPVLVSAGGLTSILSPLGIISELLAARACADDTASLPDWLRPIWPKLKFELSLLNSGWSRKKENRVKSLIAKHVPKYCDDLLSPNVAGSSLHIRFLNQALDTRSMIWFRRAIQDGDRGSSYPLLFDWDRFGSELRKFVVFCFLNFYSKGYGASLRLLPCDLLTFVDFVEWLPSAGLNVGWTSIRHYASAVRMFSFVCGYGDIKLQDHTGYKIWRENFKRNIQVVHQARGGDLPLKPWQLRLLGRQFSSDSPFDVMMRAVISLMWFTALRPGHFSPESRKTNDMKHLLEWSFLTVYPVTVMGTARAVLNVFVPSAKQNQKESAKEWSTATACICTGYTDCSSSEFQELTALCPVCALERWRRCVPTLYCHTTEYARYVFLDPVSGEPVLRSTFNATLRQALDKALAHLSDQDREEVIKMISAKSWRSGAGTELVTAGNAGFVAAAFLAHSQVDITQTYYYKGGDLDRLLCLDALANGLKK